MRNLFSRKKSASKLLIEKTRIIAFCKINRQIASVIVCGYSLIMLVIFRGIQYKFSPIYEMKRWFWIYQFLPIWIWPYFKYWPRALQKILSHLMWMHFIWFYFNALHWHWCVNNIVINLLMMISYKFGFFVTIMNNSFPLNGKWHCNIRSLSTSSEKSSSCIKGESNI